MDSLTDIEEILSRDEVLSTEVILGLFSSLRSVISSKAFHEQNKSKPNRQLIAKYNSLSVMTSRAFDDIYNLNQEIFFNSKMTMVFIEIANAIKLLSNNTLQLKDYNLIKHNLDEVHSVCDSVA